MPSGRALRLHMTSAVLLGAAAPAIAQTTTDTVSPPAQPETKAREAAVAANPVTDDIVVTARRSAESLQSTPVSVTAFSPETLRQSSIRNTQDLVIKTPGIFLAGSGGPENTVFSIRGQTKALAGSSAPAVVSYFAEVPDITVGSSIPTYDLSSVQVLKGPQGTLFGRNTTGGAILYYPTAPTYQVGGYAMGSYGNYNARLFEGAVNLPILDDHIALRIAGQYDKRDGYTKNIGVGGDMDDVNTRAIRASLLLQPIDAIRNTTIVDYNYTRSHYAASVLVDVLPGPNGLSATGTLAAAEQELALQRERGPRVTNSDIAPFDHSKRLGVTNRTEVDLATHATLVNIFGYRSTKFDYQSSADGLPTLISDGSGAVPAGLPVTIVNGRQTADIHQFTDELQLKGKLFKDKVEWLVGGFLLNSQPVGPTGTYIPAFVLPGITDVPFNYGFYKERSRAVFANISYKLDGLVEGLKLDAGIRYTWDKIIACVGSGVTNQPDASPSDCRNGAADMSEASVNRTSSKAPTWQVGLDWQATRHLFLYVVTRRGYREGGINSPTLAGRLTPFQAFGPEKVTDVEAGVRSDFRLAGMPVRVNASPFIGWYNQVQVPLTGLQTQATCNTAVAGGANAPISPDGDCNPNNDPSGGTLIVNAGKTRVGGIDFDTRIEPVHNLALTLSGTILDLKSRSLTVPAALLPYLTIQKVPFNLVAKTTLAAGIRYTLPVPETIGQTVLSADLYHSSPVRSSDTILPAYNLVNARLDINGVAGTSFDVGVFVRNIFNKTYLSASDVASNVVGEISAYYGAPRMYGLEVRYRFGS